MSVSNKFYALLNFLFDVPYFVAARKKVIILVGKGDSTLLYKNKKISPIGESLLELLNRYKIPTKILLRDTSHEKGFKYASIQTLFFIFKRLGLNNFLSWKLLLRFIRPKCIVAIDWDSTLNEVANLLKIKLFYIQHGVINEDHLYFGQNVLKNINYKKLPYGFLAWNNQSAYNFNNICRSYIVGNLWLNRFMKTDKDNLVAYYDKFGTFNQIKRGNILLTLTWGNPEFIYFNSDIITAIKGTFNDYMWLIRLHPVTMTNQTYMDGFKDFLRDSFAPEILESVEWEFTSKLPLPVILKTVDLHVTIESSCVIEAALFGIKSLIINSKVISYSPDGLSVPPYGGPSYFKLERENGFAEIWDKKIPIVDWISYNIINKPKITPNKDLYDLEWEKFLKDAIRQNK